MQIVLRSVDVAPYGIGEIIECWEWDERLASLASIAGEIDRICRRLSGRVTIEGVSYEEMEEAVELYPDEYASSDD